MMKRMTLSILPLLALASGCSMDPKYVRPDAPVPPSWPAGDPYLRQTETTLPSLTYGQVFLDPRLQQLIAQALENNRDLRIAAANIQAARAQYSIQRAEQFPAVGLQGNVNRTDRSNGVNGVGNTGTGGTGTGTGATTGGGVRTTYSANVTASFELDLFGRLASLSRADLQRYFATESAARATRITLVGDIADAWFAYAADKSLLKIAEDTAANARNSVRLTRARLEGGIAPRTDLAQAEQILATAETDLATQRTALAQDINAMRLLIGADISDTLLPGYIADVRTQVAELPAGIDSQILLRRPDVLQAEYQLRASNAQIGAARAALFPTISLTGALGFASQALGDLFKGGSFGYNAGGTATLPIFNAGANIANVRQSEAQRDAALATYERAIQSAFREVADALADRGTIAERLRAAGNGRAAAATTFRLTDARYRGGIDAYLTSLDAQRSLYTAQRTEIAIQLADARSRVTLYRVLGGDQLAEGEPPPYSKVTP